MVIAHAFLALLAGFVAMAAIAAAVTFLLARLVPAWSGAQSRPRPGYVFVNLGYSFLAAAAGGYVTAFVASSKQAAAANPLVLVLALALVVLLISALSAMQSRGKLPVWYLLAAVATAPLGVLVGGLLRLRALGIL